MDLARDLPLRAKERTIWRRIRNNWLFYVSISPFFMLFLIFGAFPIISSFLLGFTEWDGLDEPKFVGFKNYLGLFKDPTFLKSIYNTIYIWFGSTLLTLSLAFVLAFLVNYYIKNGQRFYRVVYMFPLLVAPALTAIIIGILFSTNNGLINVMWSFVAGKQIQYAWLNSELWIKPLAIVLIIWRWTGWHFIIFMSGLQTISIELYDAAKIDGANGKQMLRHITLPLMASVILFSVITATIGGIQIFDEPFVLTNGTGGTAQTGVTMGMYLYQTAFQEFHFGISSAMSYILFGLILIITLINSKLFKSKT